MKFGACENMNHSGKFPLVNRWQNTMEEWSKIPQRPSAAISKYSLAHNQQSNTKGLIY